MIHGMKNGLGWLGRAHLAIDWTNGCVAVTDREIEEILRVVPDGTPIRIEP
jgi:L,D-peptidoglycan transpeptidase YkuD (ErfK/YbiS/YcfS/YnhG family)